jgi:Polyketide cyclase / dehydrase and lipid transport
MKPVTVWLAIPQGRQEVFEFLNVLGNHEAFTDHFLLDWEVSGPRSGVGARARMRVKGPGSDDWLEMEVIAADPPRTTVEESIGARGRRRTRGTYRLDELPAGGTNVSFELAWLQAPLVERLAAPLTRAVVRRANAKSLSRLAEALAARDGPRESPRSPNQSREESP